MEQRVTVLHNGALAPYSYLEKGKDIYILLYTMVAEVQRKTGK